jgi:hypothetical protein
MQDRRSCARRFEAGKGRGFCRVFKQRARRRQHPVASRPACRSENGAHRLIIEPIAKRALTCGQMGDRFYAAGGRADEWRFHELPERQRFPAVRRASILAN